MGYTIDLSDEAKQCVAEKGYDVQYGARPLKRAIQNYIEDGISELIVNGDIPLGSVIHITKEGDELKINV
jgi:ATP-dependent Clp protease ATP-binding subunit ClpC